ncbi:MAG TPA: nucleotidyl transferase AbiEii/AbiGii toxin family protein [Thermoanaerobaculia bacterium]|nr:nucleotidyl transferase AbiEii/AbiGii toxin family protein [Thermoanaerobaculia bacterium]
MTSLESTLGRTARDLDSLSIRWALIGGLAVSVQTEPRFTRDIDLAIAASSDADAERLIRDLRSRGYRLTATLEQAARDRLATERLERDATAGPVLDLLFASSRIEEEIVQDASVLEVFSMVEAPVASLGDLIALKLLSRDDAERPQDVADLRALVRSAEEGDLARARRSARLITSRGFHRGRDLLAALDDAVEQGRRSSAR